MERTLLLVDDEENIISSLVRLLRRDGYRILCANSGKAGLALLAPNEVGVIISDQHAGNERGGVSEQGKGDVSGYRTHRFERLHRAY